MNRMNAYSRPRPRAGEYTPTPLRNGTARPTLLIVLGEEADYPLEPEAPADDLHRAGKPARFKG